MKYPRWSTGNIVSGVNSAYNALLLIVDGGCSYGYAGEQAA